MRLCIADPPYLGRGAMLYGAGAVSFPTKVAAAPASRTTSGDAHPAAAEWDDPESHRAMVERLCSTYDGWAIALNPENLHDYIGWVPRETRICAWVKPDAFPAGRIVRSWEPVLVLSPMRGRGVSQVRDGVSFPRSMGSVSHLMGAKPRAWTRWVLDLLGYDPEADTVDDLFHGSGAVAAEIAQGAFPLDIEAPQYDRIERR